MQRFIHNVALLGCFIVLTTGLWNDWGVGLTVKRMIIAYLGFFICGTGMVLAFRAVPPGDPAGRNQVRPRKGAKGSRS